MKISGARVAYGPGEAEPCDVHVRQGRLSFQERHERGETLDLRGYLLLPGLINAHDHLEFNLFPKLARCLYTNAKEWAGDICRPTDSPVKEHLGLSKHARWLWGGLKNLFSGATTVAHHNPACDPFLNGSFPVTVLRNFGWAHSLDFSPDLADRFRATPSDWPFLVHAAEGVDSRARSEIARLDAMAVLSDRTVLIHAIGLDCPGLKLIEARGSGVVWCPSSNLTVYGRTLSETVLRSGVRIALGTDSAMTAHSDLLDEIDVARRASGVSASDLYQMVTTRPAQLLRLRDGQGSIRENGIADVIAFRDAGQTPAETLQRMRPELVIVRGRIRLLAPELLDRLTPRLPAAWHTVELEGRGRWLTDMDLTALHQETVRALGPEYRLAGRRVSYDN